ncbi:hypothetical protein [Cystobacter ferrugineus]|uniref:TreTu toxin C-terminal domain-containing protein n=1 Tax=Cystobacter ferrugineus TaxID=83449 RepID=A0A1L9BFM5_9BACT|nr:hypothetical protein [Cystobacter ferrugineus]OJH41008.1 hypothetical protein BON30_08860 [Cystobacter ferrugineus]
MEKHMRNTWSRLGLLLVLPWLTNCVTRPEIRLDTGQGLPIVYTPPAAEPPPVEIRQEEFIGALTDLVLHMPLALSPPVRQQGRVVLASWGGSQGKAQHILLSQCAPSEPADGCLMLPRNAPPPETLARLRLALSYSMDSVWEGATVPISEFLDPLAFKVMVYTALSTYLVTLLLPDPLTKGLAAVLTVWLVAYLGLGPMWAMMKAGWQLLEDSQRATTTEELGQAGRRYGRVLGDNGMRVLLLLATAAIAGQTSFLTKGPKLPGFHQAAVASTARTGVRLEAAGLVGTVAMGTRELVVGLAPTAVAATAMGPGGEEPPLKQGGQTGRPTSEAGTTRVGRWMSEAEYKAMLESGRVQAPLNSAGATHVAVPPNASAFQPPPKSTHFVEFDVPTEQLRIHDPVKGWGRVFGPGSLEARAAAAKGFAVPTEMPPATNIRVIVP